MAFTLDQYRLDGKVAVVTGAGGRGNSIGRAYALGLANAGAAVVVAGCETHVCVLQTALELLEADFDVWVVTDACGSRTERNRDAAFDRLAAAGCELVTTEMVLFEWLRDAAHPKFREVHALIR